MLLFNISFDNMSRCCECDPAEQQYWDGVSDTIEAEYRFIRKISPLKNEKIDSRIQDISGYWQKNSSMLSASIIANWSLKG